MRCHLIVLAALALHAFALAQGNGDRRDVVVTIKDREIRGRVVQRFDPDEILLLQDGKRVRIPVKQVRSITTVNDHLREFFEHRHNARNVKDREWMLTEWAVSRGLDKMARLQALHVILSHDDHEEAHSFLGHQKRRDQWLWPAKSTWMTREGYEARTAKWGHPLVLEGEHFRLRTNAGMRKGLDALFDLERLYLWWFDTFGKNLRPREVLEPMDFHVYRGTEEFPAWTSNRYPYYFPQPNGDVSYTFVSENAPSPDLLFHLGTEQLLYNTLADGMSASPTDPKDRLAAWVEIGLGQWVESMFLGDPGYAEPAKAALDRSQGHAVLRSRPYGLENMIGLRYSRFHDVTSLTTLHWAHAATFVAFLMDDVQKSKTRAQLLSFIDLAYNRSKGTSSSLFDKVFETRIEKLERPWVTWLEEKVGVKARRRR